MGPGQKPQAEELAFLVVLIDTFQGRADPLQRSRNSGRHCLETHGLTRGVHHCTNNEKAEKTKLEDLLEHEDALFSANEDNPGTSSMSRDGFVSKESVKGIGCQRRVLKRQHECVREALGLFGSIGAGDVR